jgi:hypothetical protein
MAATHMKVHEHDPFEPGHAGWIADERGWQRLPELEQGGIAIGCHFPGLRAGRVLSGAWQEER